MTNKIKLALLIMLVIALILIVVQNTAPVHAKFLLLSTEMPIFVLLFLMAAGGFVAGLLTGLFVKSGARK